jgi:hypothetical protein
MPPDKGLSKGPTPGLKGNKVRLTYFFVANATGSERRDPLIIGKAFKPRCFKKKTGHELGFDYKNNAKAWMTSAIYSAYLRQWDAELRTQGRHILYLHDNFSGHTVQDNLTNIRCEFFAPNLTAHVQPMDAGVIRCFKAHYRSQFISRAIDRYDSGVSPGKIYNIDQLEAMRLAQTAWMEVMPDTICHCWAKAGILPLCTQVRKMAIPLSMLVNSEDPSPSGRVEGKSRWDKDIPMLESMDPIAIANAPIEEGLNSLQSVGILSKRNRMSIAELVDNPSEIVHAADVSDDDIFNAVSKAWENREKDNIAEGAHDANNSDEDMPAVSRKDAIQAALLLKTYTKQVNSSFARKMESMLAQFGRETRYEAQSLLRSSTLDSYFKKIE